MPSSSCPFLHGFVEFDLRRHRPVRIAHLPLSEKARQLRRDQYVLDSAHHGLAINSAGTRLYAAGTMSDYAAVVSRDSFAYKIIHVCDDPYWATNDADGPPSNRAAAPGQPGDGSHGLRVVDPAPAGLLETIVGGVAGYYLGGS